MISKLNKLNEIGLVEKQSHPLLPLIIWNYTRKVQYDDLWSHDPLLVECRGLITDYDGNIIARPFKKFWNIEENKHVPTHDFTVQEKMDGSLGILFWYEGKWILSSKGSFTSEQATKGKEILDSKYNVHPIPKGYTTLVEILYPQNRICVDYGDDESLVVLSMINTSSGKELEYSSLKMICDETNMPLVKQYDGIDDYNQLKLKINSNQEGYVIKFSNGSMCKIKGEEYVRLHKILTGFSNVHIWEYLKDKKDITTLLDSVPDEFDSWVKTTVKDLVVRYENILKDYTEIFNELKSKNLEQKYFAENAKEYDHPSILFSMLNGKDVSPFIWKLIKPEYSRPIWKKEIE
jgi:RNA ligase